MPMPAATTTPGKAPTAKAWVANASRREDDQRAEDAGRHGQEGELQPGAHDEGLAERVEEGVHGR